MKTKFHTGQTITEISILFVVLVVAYVVMQTYLKRSIQGRLRSDIDQIGSQYDFNKTTSDFTVNHVSNVTTLATTAVQPVPVPATYGTIDRSVTSSLSVTHYDNTTRTGTETVAP